MPVPAVTLSIPATIERGRTVDVVVLGSANMDLVLRVPGIPAPGETVLASERGRNPGGKGLNQAVAAARAGATTAFIGAVGDDADGRELATLLESEGIDAYLLRAAPEPTGLAVVMVEATGENSIVVAAGANATVADLTPDELAVVRSARVVLAQLEVPLPAATAAATAAREAHVRVVLNAAPAQTLPADLLAVIDVLVVNEHEARTVAGMGAGSPEEAVVALLELVPQVVVTLGAAGCLHRARDGEELRVPALPIDAVDTTGAGDAFTGVLAAALAQGGPMALALRRAVVAGALCVEHHGAVPAIPHRAQIDSRLASVRDPHGSRSG